MGCCVLARITDIAQVRTGYTFRGGREGSAGVAVRAVQIGDLRDVTVIRPGSLSLALWDGAGEVPALKEGEVLLAAKGSHNRAALLDRTSAAEPVVASSQFLILTLRPNAGVIPDYLCWVLNYPSTQRELAELRRGTNIASISKAALLQVPVPVPALDVQQQILRLQRLWDEERALYAALAQNRETMLTGMFSKLIHGESENE